MRVLLGFLTFALFFSCISTIPEPLSVPGWYTSPQEKFPSDSYLVAVGSGTTEDFATAKALSELLTQFSLSITATTSIQHRYQQDQEYSSETVDEQTNLQLESDNQLLLGLQFEKAAAGKTWYVAAYLFRPQVVPRYLLEISEVRREFATLLRSDIPILQQYNRYLQAQSLAEYLTMLYQQLRTISASVLMTLPPLDVRPQLGVFWQQLSAQLTIQVQSNEDFLTRELTAVLTDEGFRVQAGAANFFLDANIAMEEVPDARYVVIEWQLSAQLRRMSGETIASWTITDREKNTSTLLATERALYRIRKETKVQLRKVLSPF